MLEDDERLRANMLVQSLHKEGVMIPKLWHHQEKTKQRALINNSLWNLSDPGTGKTRAHIDTFAERKSKGESSKCLVVCPKSLMEPAWKADVRTFQPLLSVATAYANNREEAFAKNADITAINTDGVKYLANLPKAELERLFPPNSTLIIDESTSFKNPNTQRSKAMAKVARHFKYRQALTGTAIPNSVTELWHQVLLLDDGERLGSSYYAFRNATQMLVPTDSFPRWVDRREALETVAFMLRDLTIRFEFDDVMDVPPMSDRFVRFPLSEKMLRLYRASEAQLQIIIDEVDEAKNITPINAAAFVNKTLQLLSGAVYANDGSVRVADTARYELIADLVSERDHSVVFYSWTHQQQELSKQLDKRGLKYAVLDSSLGGSERSVLVDRYQHGDFQTILLHPKTGAHGLTLTRGRSIIWASPRYEADYFAQGLARIRRGTQDQKTENLMLCADNTLEEKVYQRLREKVAAMNQLLSTMKEAP